MDIEVIPTEHSSSEPRAHVDPKVKLSSSSNPHNFKPQLANRNNWKRDRKSRKIDDASITYDVSMARKIRIAKYIVCFLVLLSFTHIFIRATLFYSIPFSMRFSIIFAVFTSMVVMTGILIVSYTAPKPPSKALLLWYFSNTEITRKMR